ncbi:MAG: class I SAM-dependent rRNA methyltransferase [Proteobacteria bacterium]|nr:class I SAM-dependent rRNA methyltransferase [Pseudomonadota bacterium]
MSINWKPLLEKALVQRRELFEKALGETDCFRLFNGANEGISGLVIEQFSDVIIFQIFEQEGTVEESALKAMAEWLLEARKATSVYKKEFVKDRSHQAAGSDYYSPEPLLGKPANSEITVLENGVSYSIQPFAGYSTGLFLDQRENRKFLSQRAKGKQVLNLFAYTCGFSVACATQGASTTSVDLSKKYLDWGKRNFEKNQLDLGPHRFIAQDCFEFLKRCEKKGTEFDLIIVDPPSFSRTKEGGVFSLKKDLDRLLKVVAPLVSKGGSLFFSCNFSEWDSRFLQKKSAPVLEETEKWKWENTPAAPKDFESALNPISQWLAVKL